MFKTQAHTILNTSVDFMLAELLSKTKVCLNTDFNGNNSFKLN